MCQYPHACGRYDEADARYNMALVAARNAGDKGLEGGILLNLGSSLMIATSSTSLSASAGRRSVPFRWLATAVR